MQCKRWFSHSCQSQHFGGADERSDADRYMDIESRGHHVTRAGIERGVSHPQVPAHLVIISQHSKLFPRMPKLPFLRQIVATAVRFASQFTRLPGLGAQTRFEDCNTACSKVPIQRLSNAALHRLLSYRKLPDVFLYFLYSLYVFHILPTWL
ncbi:hypothetical protein BJ742DRAFT_835907 [Cladochytrium replicatum]|nr:hypothetical protein BJ742DRAFT_835907 [Cladochytrium replicatum]